MKQENAIILNRLGEFGGLGDTSPYAYKVLTYMKMAKIEHESKIWEFFTLLQESPNGLVPFINDEDKAIADSNIIVDYLEEKHGDPLGDRSLNNRQIATGKLLKSLCEHEFFHVMIYGRWIEGAHEPYVDHLYQDLPKEQLPDLHVKSLEGVSQLLHNWRIRHRDHGLYQGYMRECLDAINEFMGDGPYLFGDKPSKYDAGLFSMLASQVHFPVENPQVKIARSYPKIVEYCDRIRAGYFPNEEWANSQ